MPHWRSIALFPATRQSFGLAFPRVRGGDRFVEKEEPAFRNLDADRAKYEAYLTSRKPTPRSDFIQLSFGLGGLELPAVNPSCCRARVQWSSQPLIRRPNGEGSIGHWSHRARAPVSAVAHTGKLAIVKEPVRTLPT